MQCKLKIEQSEALELLSTSSKEFITVFEQGLITAEIYKPHLTDKQSPHEKDEFYLIISGEGKFKLKDETTTFKKGDFLFMPAHAPHCFIEFTDDFITWVFFVGLTHKKNR